MAIIKFPAPNLRPVPNKQVSFDDWSEGMVTSVEGDSRDPRTSNLIRNLTNRYRGKLVMPSTKTQLLSNSDLQYVQRWMFVYLDDTEYILAWMYNKTANHDTLEISPTSSFSWTNLCQMSTGSSPYYNVDYFDWVHSSSDGAPVIYVTYELDDGTGDTLKISYKEEIDAIPFVDWDSLYDQDTPANRLTFHKSTTSSGSQTQFGQYLVVHGSPTTPDVDGQVSAGDVILCTDDMGGSRGIKASEYIEDPADGNIGYVAVAQVLDCGDTWMLLDRIIAPHYDLVDIYVCRAYISYVEEEYDEGTYDGWYCRSISQPRPAQDILFATAFNPETDTFTGGIYNAHDDEDDMVGNALTAGFEEDDMLQYGISYSLEGGQNTAITAAPYSIIGEVDAYSRVGMWIGFADSTGYRTLFERAYVGTIEREISGVNLWRRKTDEDEWGFLAHIPRTTDANIADITEIFVAGAAFFVRGLQEPAYYSFVNTSTASYLYTTPEPDVKYKVYGFDKYFWDYGDALGETYRTINGIEHEDADNSVFGRMIASLGQRVFIGNVNFPQDNDNYPSRRLDDDVIYSVSDCGCMYALDSALGFRTGAKDALVNITIVGTNMFMFKTHSCAVIGLAGSSEFTWVPRGEFQQGLIDHRLICNTPHGPAWFSRDGIYLFSKDRPVNIAKGLLDEYMAAVGTPATCSIGYEPRYDRLYVRLGSDAYWFGFDEIERGWKEVADVYTMLSLADTGEVCGLGSSVIDTIEGSSAEYKSGVLPAWQTGELTLGPIGEEIKLKRAYIWYSYYRTQTEAGTPKVEFEWYIDGSLQDSEELDISTLNEPTSNLQRVYLNGRGRRVEFRIKFTGDDGDDWISQFELKKVEVVYKTTRLK